MKWNIRFAAFSYCLAEFYLSLNMI